MNIEHRPLSDLIPYINNARIHDEQQINQVAASIKEFGFTNPVLIDTQNGIIAGHGRVLAARKLNIEQIPCIVLKDLSEAQKKAYIIADNKLALNADWDEERLKNELERLTELDFDLDLLGFVDTELNNILNDEDFSDKNKEIDTDDFEDTIELTFKLNREKFIEVRNKLSEYNEVPELALMEILGL